MKHLHFGNGSALVADSESALQTKIEHFSQYWNISPYNQFQKIAIFALNSSSQGNIMLKKNVLVAPKDLCYLISMRLNKLYEQRIA